MSSATRSAMKDPPHATNKAVKGHKASVSTASATAKESLLVEGIENIGVKEKVDIPDDGRPLLDKLLNPTSESTSSLASLFNSQIDNANGELLLCLSAHNLNESSVAALLDPPDHTVIPPSLPLVTQSDIDKAFSTLKEAAAEVSLHASILWNPLDQASDEAAISKYSPQFTANDEDTTKRWNANDKVYVMIRSKPHTAEELCELRVAVVGNVDAGKSTLLGVITKGRLDDGRGKARVSLFRHKHEIESGRTSSVGMEILGFGPDGKEIMGDTHSRKKDLSWDEICKEAAKVVGFIDLAGHEKYFKTTIGALSSCSPDFVLLIVGANAGIVGMSKEHLSVALALNAPVVCVVTKVDSTPANVLDTTCKQLFKILRSPGCRKSPVFVKNRGMACSLASDFVQTKAAPIFLVSNVNGDGLDAFKCFLNAVGPTATNKFDATAPLELSISDVFSVPFVGCVVSGVILSGNVKTGDPVMIGPDSLGNFVPTSVRSIERKRVRVAKGEAGQSIALALKRIRRNEVRKGMVLLAPDATPKAVRRFTASVLILYHQSTIARGYQAQVHVGSIRQTVRILDIDKAFVRTGDRCAVVFEFIKAPEFCKVGARILFREGRTKGLGVITSLSGELPSTAAVVDSTAAAPAL